jgi:hypothetical protein
MDPEGAGTRRRNAGVERDDVVPLGLDQEPC